MSEPTYDSVWKGLPMIVLHALVSLVVSGLGPTLTPWTTDLKLIFDRELDNAYLIEVNGQLMILLVEYQNYMDATMPRRMFEYIATLKLIYYQQYQRDIPVLAIVIWAIPGTTPAPVYTSMATDQAGITCAYHEIHLSELDWHGVDPILLVLAPYLHGTSLDNLEEIGVQLYQTAPVEYKRLLLGAFLIISKRKFKDIAAIEQAIIQKVSATMDEIIDAILHDSRVVTIMERDKAKAELEGYLKAVTITWQHRYGAPAADVQAALTQKTIAELEAVLALMADNAPEAEARKALGL